MERCTVGQGVDGGIRVVERVGVRAVGVDLEGAILALNDRAHAAGGTIDLRNAGRTGRVRIEFKIPTRGLFGIRTEFLSETRGTGLLYHTFLEYGPYRGELASRNRGALVAKEAGDTTAYAIEPLQERSTLFLGPGNKVYGGQVVGENSRDVDMVVQVCRAKHLTNMRASSENAPGPRRAIAIDRTIKLSIAG